MHPPRINKRLLILRKTIQLAAAVFCIAVLHAQAQAQRPAVVRNPGNTNAAAPMPVQPDPALWTLTFSDEFGGEPDLARWSLHDPWGFQRPRELQGYAPEAVQASGGQLHLTASHDEVRYDGREREFRSGIVSTFGTFSQIFGRFEIRCRIPAGAGLAPSLRLFPVPLATLPEIDVFAAAGNEPTKVRFANYWGTEQTTRSFFESYRAPDLSAAFHTLAMEWDKSKIVWFIDGKETMQSTEGIPQQAMFLLLDLAVGGPLAGLPNERTRFPASFDIEYVRVYQRR